MWYRYVHTDGLRCSSSILKINPHGVMREALIIKYEGEIAEAKANIQVYMNNSVGIGEHPDIVADALCGQM